MAPVNELRFQKPQPIEVQSSADKVWEADRWPPFCSQPNLEQYDYLTKVLNYNTSEDCLHLNIWTPINRSTGQLLPVMVYIPGGAFVYMGISFDIFNGGVIASLGGVVFVTINYRLGVFGFLDTGLDEYQNDDQDIDDPNQVVKNVGLYDQIMALNWIKENIIQFGGDTNSITLMGQSAGAISIGLLMSSPLASHLFNKAILESASPMQMNLFFQISKTNFKLLLDLSNCPKPGSNHTLMKQLDCLRQIPASQLNSVQEVLMNNSLISFSPSIPSLVLSQYPREAFDVNVAESTVNQKQILLGSNANEGSLFLHQIRPKLFPLRQLPQIDRTGVKQLIQQFGSNFQNISDSQLELILDTTLDINGPNVSAADIRRQLSTLIGDFLFKFPVINFADSLAEWPNTTVYMYYFTERSGHLPEWVGSSHFEEVQFVFGLPLRYPDRYSVRQQEFSERLIKSWTQFARNGEMLPQLGKLWPKYMTNNSQHMELNSEKSSIGVKLNQTYYSLYELAFETIV